MVNVDKNILCPSCLSADRKLFSAYPGEFLCCTELHQCDYCELIFCVDIPSSDDLFKYYSGGFYYDKVNDPFHLHVLEFSKKLSLSRLDLIESKIDVFVHKGKVIDVGAGNASFGIALKTNRDDISYDVVEPDGRIREKYGEWVDRQYHDITNVESNDYNIALVNHVLEHLPNPGEFLQSICKLLVAKGYIFIEVPYKDYLYKPSVEPHLLFWNHKSISLLLERFGLKTVFCETAGMPHTKAKSFFQRMASQKTFLGKISNPWNYVNKINQLANKFGLSTPLDKLRFRQFHADEYGGERQWLRCLAQKMV